MASRIITKKGSGAPLASDLVHGELAVDTVNKRLYTENAGGTIIELGTSPSTIDINGGTIDGTVIGGSSAAAGSFTTISASGEIAANGGVAFGDNDKATFGDSDDLQIYHDGTNSVVGEVGTGNLYVQSNGAQILLQPIAGEQGIVVNSNADVGIYYDNSLKLATTSTGIDVTGTVTADGLTVEGTSVMSRFRTGSATDGRIEFAYNTTDIGYINMQSASVFDIRARSGVDLSLGAGGSERMRIDSAGNVGIGTSAPSGFLGNKLVVATGGTANEGITVYSSSNNGSLWFADATTGDGRYAGGIDYQHATNELVFYTNSQGNVRINSSGNVGIGTTSPFYKLVVSAGGASGIEFGPAYSGTANLVQHYSRSGSVYVDAVNDAAQHRFNISGSEKARIDASGNVGIGTTSPSYLVDAQSSGDAAIRIRSTGTGASDDSLLRMQIAGTTASNIIAFGDSGSSFSGEIRYTHNNNSMSFDTNDSEAMRIDSSGNVGIGTTSPAAKLEIGGAGEGIILASPDGTRYKITVANGGILIVTAV